MSIKLYLYYKISKNGSKSNEIKINNNRWHLRLDTTPVWAIVYMLKVAASNPADIDIFSSYIIHMKFYSTFKNVYKEKEILFHRVSDIFRNVEVLLFFIYRNNFKNNFTNASGSHISQ